MKNTEERMLELIQKLGTEGAVLKVARHYVKTQQTRLQHGRASQSLIELETVLGLAESEDKRRAKENSPTSLYQCVSAPGSCKFEWNCGPTCSCVLKKPAGTEQEKADVAEAERRQEVWRKERGLA